MHVVAMGTGHSGELPVAAVKKVLHVPDLTCIPDDPVAKIRSINVGQSARPRKSQRQDFAGDHQVRRIAHWLMRKTRNVNPAMRPAAAVKAAAVVALNTLPFSNRVLGATNTPEGNRRCRKR